jgi:mono/diheme cytochrome c family protein
MRLRAIILAIAVVVAACGGSSRSPLLADGRDLYTAKGCVACHGGQGEGGVGPALDKVVTTFPSCETHIEWVRLGAQKWIETHGPTYGAAGKPIEVGVMPSTEETMTDLERRTVVAYERIELGGLGEEEARADCGL